MNILMMIIIINNKAINPTTLSYIRLGLPGDSSSPSRFVRRPVAKGVEKCGFRV